MLRRSWCLWRAGGLKKKKGSPAAAAANRKHDESMANEAVLTKVLAMINAPTPPNTAEIGRVTERQRRPAKTQTAVEPATDAQAATTPTSRGRPRKKTAVAALSKPRASWAASTSHPTHDLAKALALAPSARLAAVCSALDRHGTMSTNDPAAVLLTESAHDASIADATCFARRVDVAECGRRGDGGRGEALLRPSAFDVGMSAAMHAPAPQPREAAALIDIGGGGALANPVPLVPQVLPAFLAWLEMRAGVGLQRSSGLAAVPSAGTGRGQGGKATELSCALGDAAMAAGDAFPLRAASVRRLAEHRLLGVAEDGAHDASPQTVADSYLALSMVDPRHAAALRSKVEKRLRALLVSPDAETACSVYLADAILDSAGVTPTPCTAPNLVKLLHTTLGRDVEKLKRAPLAQVGLLLGMSQHLPLLTEQGRIAMWCPLSKAFARFPITSSYPTVVLYAFGRGVRTSDTFGVVSTVLLAQRAGGWSGSAMEVAAKAGLSLRLHEALASRVDFTQHFNGLQEALLGMTRYEGAPSCVWKIIEQLHAAAPLRNATLFHPSTPLAHLPTARVVATLKTFADEGRRDPEAALGVVRFLTARVAEAVSHDAGTDVTAALRPVTVVVMHRSLIALGFFSMPSAEVQAASSALLLQIEHYIGAVDSLDTATRMIGQVHSVAPSHARRLATVVRHRLAVLAPSATPVVRSVAAKLFFAMGIMTPAAAAELQATGDDL